MTLPGRDDEDPDALTHLDIYDQEQSRRDACTSPGDWRLAARVADVRQAVCVVNLEPLERLVLVARLQGLENEEVAELSGYSPGTISTKGASGVRKLREHFAVTS
jgi:DNA-directed RNA polymerase specialized sigma24 family protein